MTWVMYLYIVTSVVGKADVVKRWTMTTQTACEAQVAKARIVTTAGPIEINASEVTSIDARAVPPASVVLLCVQEPAPAK